MDVYERMIHLMRKSGGYFNGPVPAIGIVMEDKKIRLGGWTLTKKDYLMDCNLRFEDVKKVFYHKEKTASGEYVTDGSHNGTLEEYVKNILKEGDKVLMLQLTDMHGEKKSQFILLSKVVEP